MNKQIEMSVTEAEEVLDQYGTRECATLNGDGAIWDAAYDIAFAAYRERNNTHVNGQPA